MLSQGGDQQLERALLCLDPGRRISNPTVLHPSAHACSRTISPGASLLAYLSIPPTHCTANALISAFQKRPFLVAPSIPCSTTAAQPSAVN